MARVRARMHPGRVLREEYMEPMQLSAHELAEAIDVTPNRISAIIDDSQRHSLTSDIALRLARRTEWLEQSEQTYFGLGQRAFITDVAETALLDVRRIDINPAGGAGIEPA